MWERFVWIWKKNHGAKSVQCYVSGVLSGSAEKGSCMHLPYSADWPVFMATDRPGNPPIPIHGYEAYLKVPDILPLLPQLKYKVIHTVIVIIS